MDGVFPEKVEAEDRIFRDRMTDLQGSSRHSPKDYGAKENFLRCLDLYKKKTSIEEYFPFANVWDELMNYLDLVTEDPTDPITLEKICDCHKNFMRPCTDFENFTEQVERLNVLHLRDDKANEYYNGILMNINMNNLMTDIKNDFEKLNKTDVVDICELVKIQMNLYSKTKNKKILLLEDHGKGIVKDDNESDELLKIIKSEASPELLNVIAQAWIYLQHRFGISECQPMELNESDKMWNDFSEYVASPENWPELKNAGDEFENIEMNILRENCVPLETENLQDIWNNDQVNLWDCGEKKSDAKEVFKRPSKRHWFLPSEIKERKIKKRASKHKEDEDAWTPQRGDKKQKKKTTVRRSKH